MISYEEVTGLILNKLNKHPDDILGNIKKISWNNLIYGLITQPSLLDVANISGMSRNTLKSIIAKNLDSGGLVTPALNWSIYLLAIVGYKKCTKCEKLLAFSFYHKDKTKTLGITSSCKVCQYAASVYYREENRDAYLAYLTNYRITHAEEYRARANKYRASKIQRCPAWADLDKIKEIYNNCPEGYHVDHIIPLNGDTVSGLHVANNLQYLLPKDNIAKSNKYNPSVANIGKEQAL